MSKIISTPALKVLMAIAAAAPNRGLLYSEAISLLPTLKSTDIHYAQQMLLDIELGLFKFKPFSLDVQGYTTLHTCTIRPITSLKGSGSCRVKPS